MTRLRLLVLDSDETEPGRASPIADADPAVAAARSRWRLALLKRRDRARLEAIRDDFAAWLGDDEAG